MELSKRQFLIASGAALVALPLGQSAMASTTTATTTAKSVKNKDLKSLTDNVKPISVTERKARIAKAQQLMQNCIFR